MYLNPNKQALIVKVIETKAQKDLEGKTEVMEHPLEEAKWPIIAKVQGKPRTQKSYVKQW